MKFEAAFLAVQAFFNTHWGTETKVAWPDKKFTPPNETWVRFTMKSIIARQASIGSPNANYHRRNGIITIQIFGKPSSPNSTGSAEARAKVNKAVDIFLKQRLSGVTFSNTNAIDVGADNGWYQWNVTAEYEYYDIA